MGTDRPTLADSRFVRNRTTAAKAGWTWPRRPAASAGTAGALVHLTRIKAVAGS